MSLVNGTKSLYHQWVSYLLRMQEMLQQERKGNMIIGAIFTKLSQVINKILIKWK